MEIEIRADVDRQHSVDPGYIIRYQVFENGRFIGDGTAQYHRLAAHNDYHIPATIKRPDGTPPAPGDLEKIKSEIARAAKEHIYRA